MIAETVLLGPARPETTLLYTNRSIGVWRMEEEQQLESHPQGLKQTDGHQSRTGYPGIERESAIGKKARRRLLPGWKRS